MVKNLFLSLSVILALTMTSCLGNDDDQTSTETFTAKCFNKIQDGEDINCSEANYAFEFDYTTGTISISSYDEKIYTTSFKISGLKLVQSESLGNVFQADNPVVTDISGNVLKYLSITNLYGQIATVTNEIGGEQYSYPIVRLRFTLNGTNTVYVSSIQNGFLFSSTTTYTNSETSKGFYENTGAAYVIDYNFTDFSATLTMKNVKFALNMPAMDIVAKGVKFTPAASGIKFAADSICPTISDTPYPSYALKNIQGTLAPNFTSTKYFLGEQLDMTFNCMQYTVVVKATSFSQE